MGPLGHLGRPRFSATFSGPPPLIPPWATLGHPWPGIDKMPIHPVFHCTLDKKRGAEAPHAVLWPTLAHPLAHSPRATLGQAGPYRSSVYRRQRGRRRLRRQRDAQLVSGAEPTPLASSRPRPIAYPSRLLQDVGDVDQMAAALVLQLPVV